MHMLGCHVTQFASNFASRLHWLKLSRELQLHVRCTAFQGCIPVTRSKTRGLCVNTTPPVTWSICAMAHLTLAPVAAVCAETRCMESSCVESRCAETSWAELAPNLLLVLCTLILSVLSLYNLLFYIYLYSVFLYSLYYTLLVFVLCALVLILYLYAYLYFVLLFP